MAEGGADVNAAEDLELEITCSVCHGHFEDPRILPCSHCFCKSCIQTLSTKSGPIRPFRCPECRTETDLPRNDANQLPKGLLASKMKELYEKLQKQANPGYEICTKHDDPLRLFCFDCNCLICRDCTVFDHKGHTSKFIKDVAPALRTTLRREMVPLKAAHQNFTKASEQAKELVSAVAGQTMLNTAMIEQWMSSSVEVINKVGRDLITETKKLSLQKIQSMNAQIQTFEKTTSEIESLEKICEQTLENTTNKQYVEMHMQIMGQVKATCTKHKSDDLQLSEVDDLRVLLPSDNVLSQFCHNKANIVAIAPDPASCTVDIESAEVNKRSRFIVHTRYRNGKPCTKPQTVEGSLESLVNDSLIQLKGTKAAGNSYEIAFTPQIRGHHLLVVTLNGKNIRGSPFTVCVKMPPTQLGTPVRVIGLRGFGKPYAIAFNSSGKVLISVGEEIVTLVINTKSKVQHEVKKLPPNAEQSLWDRLLSTNPNLQGIAVDRADNVFVTDGPHSNVYKQDKDGKRLKVIGKYGSGNSEFKYPRGVAVKGEHVFVCDRDNHRIQIFNRELEFVKSIGAHGKGNGLFNGVYDVCPCDNGNLYVCDCLNNRIQILTGDGHFLSTFGIEGTGDGELNRPVSVCVAGQFVYVADFGNSRISVFDRNGHFVALFNTEGNGASAVRVDRDGFVHACFNSTSSVRIF